MNETHILHIYFDKQLIGIMTPDLIGMDHIVYPEGTGAEFQEKILTILKGIPNSKTLEQRIQDIINYYNQAGFTVEEI